MGRAGNNPSDPYGSSAVAGAVADRVPAITPPSWRFLVLVEIGNFTALRRLTGRARAETITREVAERAAAITGAAAVHTIGRGTFELEIAGTGVDRLHHALDRLDECFADPVDLDGEPQQIELVVAAAASPIAAMIEDERLAEEAEDALVQARQERRRVVRDTVQGLVATDKETLRHELVAAIARDEVFLQYQPKIHVRRQEVASAEALVRWNHPTRGLVLPGDFIPLAEDAQLIGALTLWTLRRVIADQRTLAADGHDLVIFINISGQLLSDSRFIEQACRMIAESDARIGFEITETSMIRDPDSAIAHLRIIAEGGVPIAIDDYGAGLSSLAYLKKLPASELKIDKMFVMELTSSNRDPLIVRSTIDLAHALEMEVTAEGVETPAALALLSVMGCDLIQGFLISRPLSLPAFRRFLASEAAQTMEQAQASFRRPLFGRMR